MASAHRDSSQILCLFVLLLVGMSGLRRASAQDYDWTDEDLPEFVEDFGYEDADYDGPDLVAASSVNRTQGMGASSTMAGQARPRQCDCIHCRETLFGDCLGCRSQFQESGIMYRGRVTQFFFGVAGGVDQSLVPPQFSALGIEGGDQFEYTGNSQHDFLIDLDKFGGCPQSKLIISLENIWGRFGNVSLETGATAPTIFNAFMPVDPETDGVPRLTNFVYVQPLSEGLVMSVGKKRIAGIADNNIFAGGDGSDQFLNQIFCANPLFVSQLPLSTFSVSAVMPRKWGNVAISLIDPVERSTEYFRFDDLFSEGMMLFGQIKVKTTSRNTLSSNSPNSISAAYVFFRATLSTRGVDSAEIEFGEFDDKKSQALRTWLVTRWHAMRDKMLLPLSPQTRGTTIYG